MSSKRICEVSCIKGQKYIKSTDQDEEVASSEEFTICKWRWVILTILSLLILSNSMSRIACGPVAYTSATFYNTNVSNVPI